MPFTDSEIAYLDEQPLGRLATLRPDGSLQNSPVGLHYNRATDAGYGTGDPIIRIHPKRIISYGVEEQGSEPSKIVPNNRTVA